MSLIIIYTLNWRDKVNKGRVNSKKLWQNLSGLRHTNHRTTIMADHTAQRPSITPRSPPSHLCWKKTVLDSLDLKNFRPVSNLSFLSKIIEKVVHSRMVSHLEALAQFAYRCHHNTETALLKVFRDIATAVDGERVMALYLLDLSAVFDMVGHSILL